MLKKNGKSTLEKVNKIFENNFYMKYSQYEGRNLTMVQMKNIAKLYKNYPEFSDETLSNDFLKLNLTKTADNFFKKHKEYKGRLLMGDMFIVNDFFDKYPKLQNGEQVWAIEDIDKFRSESNQALEIGENSLQESKIEQGNSKIKEINSFYADYPEYIGVYLNQNERQKIEKFIKEYPGLSGKKWSFEAIDEFGKMEFRNREYDMYYINEFYKKYPEYKGDYLEKGRILTLQEIYKLEDFLGENQDLKGYKWDIKAIYALDELSIEERSNRLDFYRKNPEIRTRYVNEELFNYEREQIEHNNKLRNSLLEKVKRFVSSLKLKNIFAKKFTKKVNKEVELEVDNITYKGIPVKVLEKYPEYKGTSLNKKQMKMLADYYKDERNEQVFFSLKGIERLNKDRYNETKGYVTYNEGYGNGYTITESLDVPEQCENFYKENPEYKGYPLLVEELENAIVFSKKFPELKGVVWEPQEMEEVLKLSKQEQIKIKEFYRDNPDYKQSGILLSPKKIQQINEIYTTYPEQKGNILNENEIKRLYRSRRWVNLKNELGRYQKETQQRSKIVNKFYADYPQYGGVDLTKENVKQLNEFFKEYPVYKVDNVSPEDAKVLKNFLNKNPEYKESRLRAVDVEEVANTFCERYPKLKSGKRWDVSSMEEFMKEGIEGENKTYDRVALDRAINVFYNANPEYKGIYLDKNQRKMVSKFFREYPALKGDKAWKLEAIEKFNKGVAHDKKSYVNQFYDKNPSYKGQYLELEEMDKIDKFFDKHEGIERSNWEVKAIDAFEKSEDKARILAIYKARPDLNGVYLMEADKDVIERNMGIEKKKHGINFKFGNNKSKKKTNVKGREMKM